MQGIYLASPKMTRSQRKAGAELREARRTAERLRRQRASYRKRHNPGIFERMLGAVHSWHVAVRGTTLVAVAILGIALFLVGSGIEERRYEADKALVNAVEPQAVLWTATSRKGFTTHVETDGRRVSLDRSPPMFSGQDEGDTIMVVVDPDDESHVVAANFDDTYLPVEPMDHIIVFLAAAGVFLVSFGGVYLAVLFFLYPELRALTRKVRAIKPTNQ